MTATGRPGPPTLMRVVRIVAWVGGVALLLLVLNLLGIPVSKWISDLFKQIRAVPAGAVAGGAALETLQTVFAAAAWPTVRRAAFPSPKLPFRPLLAAYAAAVALNAFTPAHPRS